MMDKFFSNLRQFKSSDVNTTVFPYHQHVQTRLEFLTVVFSMMGSPEEFRFVDLIGTVRIYRLYVTRF
jgi:hypothetical protein